MYTINEIKNFISNSKVKKRIVLPEGNEPSIIKTANYLVENNLAIPIVIFETSENISSDLNSQVEKIILDSYDLSELRDAFLAIRKEKATLEIANTVIKQPNYVGTLLVELGKADCMLLGLTYTTADSLRPALQIIKTAPGYSLASSVLIMQKDDQSLLFTDCGFNIKPNAAQLVDITKMTVEFARSMNVKEPEAALLSYSTNGSGKGEDVIKVQSAVSILKEQKVDFNFAGEVQFDAAFDQTVRSKKFPTNTLTKLIPDVFVFPDINAGNIGYKIAQRMGNWNAIGPFILGLNKPVNDLSRGATLEDIISTAIITIFQASEVA
ncbi:phosphate acetyltransferase [Mesoplasma syrphidae]|uniref:Phosphate acetyltransferase n=1 Tax=Mesoplasma syrphidae TaxID=225999 RepID=A0A2K9BMH6_9MOLU|nr:phosphate acetyltransferase [Mesoplasma syrphidae]AUF83243.1 phosphate acetyltransferase [Mesoplasma syrphidae]